MKALHFLAGLLLLPVCVAASQTVFDLVRGIHSGVSLLPPPALSLVGGFAVWLLLYYTLPHPVRSYILAHELTHALWASLMGVEVSDLKVGKNGGSVTLAKSNFLIVLAPYFFPLYTMGLLVAYYLSGLFFEVERYYLVWLGLIGFSWGYHFTFTIATLLQHQPDIHQCGRLFSYSVIYTMNILGIGLWIVLVSPATLEQMVGRMQGNCIDVLHSMQNLLGVIRERIPLQ